MRGNPDSCGVWAPCLSYADGLFWLVYTNMRRLDGAFKDSPNYITTCSRIDGDWSDPIYVNNSGFDPSLFHDDDGKKYFINQQWNHRGEGTGGNPKHASFDGILLQQWDPVNGLVGECSNIYPGTERGLVEAPHLFKRNNWYYLTVAEGGTGYEHAVTMARSRDLLGPYETHPDLHLLCAANAPDHVIQRTGHGQYVETHWGDVYHSFLMGRPQVTSSGSQRYCQLGRETGLERCIWKDDDWLYLEAGGQLARETVPAPGSPVGSSADPIKSKPVANHYQFQGAELPEDFQWLRTPYPERLFRLGDDALTLIGRESLGSWFEQSLVARRQQHFSYSATTTIDYEPECYQQAAGLTTYYNRFKFHALLITNEPGVGRCLILMSCPGDYPDGALSFALESPQSVPDGTLELRVDVDHARQQFYWRVPGSEWERVGTELDATCISDEGGRGEHASFTGAFCGMIAFDQTGQGREARFLDFQYNELNPES